MTITKLAGLNIYSIIGVLIAASLLFHMISKEEMIIGIIAVVVIVYMTRGDQYGKKSNNKQSRSV